MSATRTVRANVASAAGEGRRPRLPPGAPRSSLRRLRPARVALALAAGLMLAGSLVVTGAPLWVSACLGVFAGLRVSLLPGGR
jgi:hypothetical protein